jgi:hypothetical protein
LLQAALDAFLQGYPVPEELFDALLFKTKDKFSWIVDDYLELEGQIQGTTKNNGVEFGLKYRPGSTTNILVMCVISLITQMHPQKY